MVNYARVANAKQAIAKKIDHATDNGHYMMVKQVRHDHPTENVPTTSPHPQNFAASPPQICSPTSALLHSKKLLKISRAPASASTLASTQRFEAMMDPSVHNTTNTSRLTPTQKFEQILDRDLEAKTKAEVQRAARWYPWW